MNLTIQRQNYAFANSFSFYSNCGLKSTEEKQKRQMQCDREIGFWEERKENLKTMECDSLEEISRKLGMLHSYEEEISAAKAAYNNEQMWHAMDEAREMGEKIAEAAEKLKPKTPEEREEERREEALGIEEDKGEVSELLEGMEEQDIEELPEDKITDKIEELEAELEQQEASGDGESLIIEEEGILKDTQELLLERQRIRMEKRMIIEEYAIRNEKRFDMRV